MVDGVGPDRHDLSDGDDAVDVRHRDIEDRHVGTNPQDRLDRLTTVCCELDHVGPDPLETHLERLRNECVIIGEHYAHFCKHVAGADGGHVSGMTATVAVENLRHGIPPSFAR
jgi:hypothetical protein